MNEVENNNEELIKRINILESEVKSITIIIILMLFLLAILFTFTWINSIKPFGYI